MFPEDVAALPWAVSRLLFSPLCFTPWAPRGAVAAALTTAAMISLTDTQSKYSPGIPAWILAHPLLELVFACPPAPLSGSMNEARCWGRRPAGLSYGCGTRRAALRGRELDLQWQTRLGRRVSGIWGDARSGEGEVFAECLSCTRVSLLSLPVRRALCSCRWPQEKV